MDFKEQLHILEAAKGNPALLALATVDLAHDTVPADERSRIKEALLAAAVPHWCDRDFLAALLQTTPEESDRLLSQLDTLTVLEPFPARGERAVNVHEAARLALREHLRTSDAALWQALSARARADVVQSREPHARIEALYHLFATDQPAAATECEALNREFAYGTGHPEVRHALALALRELTTAGWLTGAAEVEALLPPLEIRIGRGEAAQIEVDVRRLVALAHAASHPSGIGRTQCLLGDVLNTKGRRGDALAAYREYLAIFQRLASTDLSNADWQRDLASAHSKVGGIHQAQGGLDDALAAFRETLAISQRLASADPTDAGRQRELASSHCFVGEVYQAQGRLDDALIVYREYLAIFQRLTSADPSNADWQSEFARALSRVGDIYQAQGRLDDALVRYREYLAIFQRLTSADPSNADWQSGLAVAHARVGDICQAQGRLDDALVGYREDLAIFQRLTSADPSNADWQSEFARAHARVGDICQAQGRLDDAFIVYREYLAIFQRLTSADPSNAGWQRELAFAHHQLGQVFRTKGDEQEAQSNFHLAVENLERAMAMAPGNVGWQNDLNTLKASLASVIPFSDHAPKSASPQS